MSSEYYGSITQDQDLKKLNGLPSRLPEQPTNIDFLMVRHQHASDLPDDISEKMAQNDVILIEGAHWRQSHQDNLQAISNGDASALKHRMGELKAQSTAPDFQIALTNAIYDTGREIRFCDIPYNRNSADAFEKVLFKLPPGEIAYPRFVSIVRNYYQHFIKEGLYLRDKHILRNIHPVIAEASPDPNTTTMALFVLGSVHRSIPYAIKRSAVKLGQYQHTVSEEYFGHTPKIITRAYTDFLAGNKIQDIDYLRMLVDENMKSEHDLSFNQLAETSHEDIKPIIISSLGRHGVRIL